jgi:pectate lyase-like protein
MADVTYTPQGPWENYPDTSTPITAEKLTGFDDGIAAATAQANAARTTATLAVPLAQRGADNGVATLDANGKVPSDQLPTNPEGVFYVADYGAKGDGATDDTTAIRNAINDAVTAALAGNHLAVVQFEAKTYAVNGSLVQGGTTKGNAILPLPIIPDTGPKVTLIFKGAGDVSALPHWNQTVAQKAGTVLSTTVAGTNSGTFGEACVLGGPNVPQGYGKLATYSNMLVVVDGISISVPNNPSISGFDFCGVAEANIITGSCFVNAAGPVAIIAPTSPNQWTFGLRMPFVGNNANNTVWKWSCEGLCYGLIISELSIVYWAACVYCIAGIAMTGGSNSSTPHRATIFFCTVQWCQTYLQALGTASPLKLDIWMLDIETSGGAITGPPGFGLFKLINDASNTLQGVCYIDAGGSAVNPDYFAGASQFRVIASNQLSGAVTAPAVPATTVPQQNRFLRDAAVYVAGGTVSDIKVDGASIGVTSGMVMVPAGKSITLTYSAAPTWKWTLL